MNLDLWDCEHKCYPEILHMYWEEQRRLDMLQTKLPIKRLARMLYGDQIASHTRYIGELTQLLYDKQYLALALQ